MKSVNDSGMTQAREAQGANERHHGAVVPCGSPMTGGPLRVGLLLDTLDLPIWTHKIIEDMRTSTQVDLALIVLNDAPSPPPPPLVKRLAGYRKVLLYELYRRLDAWYFGDGENPLANASVRPLLENVPIIRVCPRMTRFCDYFRASDVERIRTYDLDVALRLGFRLLKGDALGIARHGVWSYHHGDNRVNRGGPAGFWEVVENRPATGALLQILSSELDGGRTIYHTWNRTDRFSFHKNRSALYWKSAAFVSRKLHELAESGPEAIFGGYDEDFQAYDERLWRQPTNREIVRILPRLASRYARQKAAELVFFEQWFVAYKFRRSGPDDIPDGTFYNFKSLIPPKDRFWADPFPIVRDGRAYIFMEEFLYRERKGRIVAIEIGDRGVAGEPITVLERDYHLSFPNIFQWNGGLYMIPEAAGSGALELYRCASFPGHWEHEANLLEDTPGADPVIANIGEHWWLFTTMPAANTSCWDDELYLFHGPTPLGPWVPHRKNPVKSDVRSARSAGRIFRQGGRVFRPAQDCSGRYGSGIVLNEILRLNESEFSEKTVSTLRPRWRRGLLGLHTLNSAGRLTVMDGLQRRRRLL